MIQPVGGRYVRCELFWPVQVEYPLIAVYWRVDNDSCGTKSSNQSGFVRTFNETLVVVSFFVLE